MSMAGRKSINTPINNSNHWLGEKQEKEELVDWGIYQRMVGKLIYLSYTRSNIAYAMSVVSQFMHAPLKPYLEAIQNL